MGSSGTGRTGRGGRVASEGGRGRGRATERGGGRGARGKSTHTATNGTRNKENQPLSVPTEDSSAWDTTTHDNSTAWGDSEATPTTAEPTPAVAAAAVSKKASAAPDSGPKTWASMLRQSTAPKPTPKAKELPVPKPAEPSIEPLPPVELAPAEVKPTVAELAATEIARDQAPPQVAVPVQPESALPPTRDRLTENNLEHVVDTSHPPETETVRSEAADSWNPNASAASSAATPLSTTQQHQASRGPSSGFAASAIKATERTAARTPSYQRRLLDQEEAVRMPGNRDQVDRAAVQFGAFSLNGPVDDDIDGDREEPETRAQPPDDSPVAHPRTSLPPPQPAPIPEGFSAQKPAATLPPPPGSTGTESPSNYFLWAFSANATPAAPTAPSSQPALASQGMLPPFPRPNPPLIRRPLIVSSVPASQATAQNSQQYGLYGQAAPQEPSAFPSQKQFDAYGQQQSTAATSQNPFEGGGFPSQAQAPQAPSQQQPGVPGSVPAGAFSSAPADYSSYYTADQHSRAPFNYYNQQYGQQQQGAQGQQDGLASQQAQQQQRAFSGYNAPQSDNLNQYPQGGVQHTQGRYGAAAADVQTSGNTTPNPSAAQGQQQAGQGSQAQSHGQQQQPHADFPYNHPYYNSPYYAAYMNQYQGGYNQGAYGGPYGKGGAYNQPHQYGMSPQVPYGHASSPAAAGGFGQNSLHRGDSAGVAAGLSEYGRAGSAQSGNQPGLGAGGFGGVQDSFSRGASAYQSQAAGQPYNAPASQQGNPPAGNDDLKPFGDSKTAGGPSPSLGAAARPVSATNNAPAGLPPPQSNQQGLGMSGYGGYPSHVQGHGGLHGNQSAGGGYGMSASGGQGHNNTPYGGYGAQGFSSGSYYANPPRGWGGNYH